MLNPDEKRSIVAVVLLSFRVNALNVMEAGICLWEVATIFPEQAGQVSKLLLVCPTPSQRRHRHKKKFLALLPKNSDHLRTMVLA